jgi:tellurite resistance protein
METITTHDSLLAVCLLAAFSNGEQSDAERREISRYAEEMDADNLAELSRRILMGKLTLEQACGGLGKSQDRMLAYVMARAICESGGSISPEEEEFLTELRQRLGLAESESGTVDQEVDSVALAPLAPAASAGPRASQPLPAGNPGTGKDPRRRLDLLTGSWRHAGLIFPVK